MVPRLLVMKEHPMPEVQLGLRESQFEIALELLQEMGVPKNAIDLSENTVLSTRDEAVELRRYADAHGPKTFVVPTDPAHSRRSHWILNKALEHDDSRALIAPIDPINYDRSQWWLSEHGIVFLFSEMLKFAYYQIRYAQDPLTA